MLQTTEIATIINYRYCTLTSCVHLTSGKCDNVHAYPIFLPIEWRLLLNNMDYIETLPATEGASLLPWSTIVSCEGSNGTSLKQVCNHLCTSFSALDLDTPQDSSQILASLPSISLSLALETDVTTSSYYYRCLNEDFKCINPYHRLLDFICNTLF